MEKLTVSIFFLQINCIYISYLLELKFYGLGQVNNAKHESKRHVCSLRTEEDEILQSSRRQRNHLFAVRVYVAFSLF